MATKKATPAKKTVARKPAPAPVAAVNLFDPNAALPQPVPPVSTDVRRLLRVKRLHKAAVVPSFATSGAACFDIATTLTAVVAPGRSKVFDTGLAFEVPEGYVLKVYSRSGHGFKNDVRLGNSVGIIDSDYRGELKIKIRNDGTEPFKLWAGDRIAQAMLEVTVPTEIVEVETLSETERGAGGFGSTGA